MKRVPILWVLLLGSLGVFAQTKIPNAEERIALNFMRPDANRPGNYDFVNNGPWLVGEFKKLGVKWNRVAFSWVVIQPEEKRYDWSAYDRIVDACEKNGIEILATLGGHFDRPPVPAWAGATLAEVVEKNPATLEAFIRAWVQRYHGRIHYYEMLNEPKVHHQGLTVKSYVEGVLRPGYRIVKSLDPSAKVLPCAYNNLPVLGNKEEFWDLARGSYDIGNYHQYADWGIFRTEPTGERDEREVCEFRAEMDKHGEKDKPFWLTEIGFWGTGSLAGIAGAGERDPALAGKFKPFYTGREYLDHPAVAREDAKRALWIKDVFPRVLSCLAAEPATKGSRDIPVAVLQDKVRGGLLGEMLGDLNGLKHEMRYIAEPGNVETYVPGLPQGAWTDDDTDIEWIYVVEMQRSKEMVLSSPRIAELWKRHINRRIWCSHQYLRQLMDIGIEPPLTGMISINPWADFNLSGQFVSETWGLISPCMPQTAARLSLHYTHVSIQGEPSQAAQLFATMIATAYLTADIEKILDAGEAALDPKSEFHQILREVRHWHSANPADWRATRRLIRDKYTRYGGDDVRDRNGVILNGAATIAALLYGRGDFVETVRHAFNFGWDADNNAATSGTILGVIKGHQWLMSQGLDIQDRFRNTSRDNMPMDETITSFGDRMVALTDQVITEHGGKKMTVAGELVYRLKIERPANLERLPDLKQEPVRLRKQWKKEIEQWIAKAEKDGLARAAYLAICLDLAPDLRRDHPEQWVKALAALQSQPKVMQALFYESPVPAGDALRAKAVAAGLVKPAEKISLWTEK